MTAQVLPFCQKLMQERHYSATSLIWTNADMEYGSLAIKYPLVSCSPKNPPPNCCAVIDSAH